MKYLFHLTIILSVIINIIKSDCPTGFVKCAREHSGQSCRIPDTIRDGLLSYGASGRFNFIPFTNTKNDGTDMLIQCDNDHGDIAPGIVKTCCYKNVNAGFPQNNWKGYKKENDGGFRHFGDFDTQRYGADNRYVMRVITKSVGWCNNDFFNDPLYGTVKHCNYNQREPASLKNAQFKECSNENGNCYGLIANKYYWIRYGDNGSYYYRLVSSSVGHVPCNNNFFDDPLPGVSKFCWRSNPFSLNDANIGIINDDEPDSLYFNDYKPSQSISSQKWWHFKSYINNNITSIFIYIVLLLLFVNISCLTYFNYIKKRNVATKNKYQSVKIVDSESELDQEAKPLNVAL